MMASRALSSCRLQTTRLGRAFYSTNQQKPTAATGGETKPLWIPYPERTISEYRFGVPASTGPKHTTRKAKVTTLPNGVRVASLTSNDLGRSVGLYVAAGTKDEGRGSHGVNHLLKYAAYGSSGNKAGYQVVRELEAAGATLNATSGREHLLFSSEFPPNNTDTVVPILSNMLSPKLPYHEVVKGKALVSEDVERLESDTVAHVLELLHRQAYRNRGLGQSLTANKEDIHHLSQNTIYKWVTENYTPNKVVLVGVGFEHEELVKSVEAALSGNTFQHTFDHNTHDAHSHHGEAEAAPQQKLAGKYTGGERLESASGYTHFAIAFEGASLKGDTKEAVALGVLQHVLGSIVNGNAGSQVGLGASGRLATNVLSHNQSAHALSAFNFSYTDSGLFGVYAETNSSPGRLAQQVAAELAKLRTPLSAEELARGKAAYKFSLLDLRRTPTMEFIGSQVLASGKAVTPEEFAAQVDSITAADVAAVAKKVLATRPTFVAVGDVAQFPSSEELSSAISHQ